MIKKIFSKSEKSAEIDSDDKRIIDMLYDVKRELDYVHQEFDNITDAILIDSFIYEIQALNMKYQYYIKLCKEKGLIAGGFESI